MIFNKLFSKTKKEKNTEDNQSKPRKEPQPERIIERMVKMTLDKVYEEVSANMPDKGPFKPISAYFRVPDSEFLAVVQVQADTDTDKRRMRVFAHKEYSDRAANHFYPAMSSDEMKAYLQSEEAVEEVSDSVRTLTAE